MTATLGANVSYVDYIMQSNNIFPKPKQTSSLPVKQNKRLTWHPFSEVRLLQLTNV